MRSLLGLVALTAVPAILATSAASVADEPRPCAQSLTFRWTSGRPIQLDVSHPPAAALQNPPFLTDPEISSATRGENRLGANVVFTLGPAAAGVLKTETASHLQQQLLIMLGDTVISAAIVREPVGDTVVVSGFDDGGSLTRLAELLRKRC
jgi:preprotein translocase subunit SecD